MQLGEPTDAHADVIVPLGGLTMPKTGINPEKANEIARKVLENSEKKRIIGLCFQSMFMQQKWDKIIWLLKFWISKIPRDFFLPTKK
jgi:hypothetical protein